MALKAIKIKKDIFCLMNKYAGSVSKIETELLLKYLFNCAKLDLYIGDFTVNETMEELYDSLISRRMSGEPVQYITGCAEFMGLDFVVTKDVLIPRPETEILVNEALDLCSSAPVRILDLCTGSGNIAISLAKLIPQAEIVATDISDAALKIAEKNVIRHNVSDRIKFCKGNLFNALVFDTLNSKPRNDSYFSVNSSIKQEYVVKNPKFDIIVCNPPYIKEEDLPLLQKEVRAEPKIALSGGKDGLDFYRIIAKESHRYLKENGSILTEIGFGQAQAVEDIFSSNSTYKIYKTIRDFNQIDRVITLQLVPGTVCKVRTLIP
ncbi:MAG: peptide chain release factor N(5)-glutamine methyltransferase [Candidatus Omnitrophica bacterium]|nr:peptide chain release factor N(5)-glutamine methyltransferase [Candidatus Omnitrophota bacterium]